MKDLGSLAGTFVGGHRLERGDRQPLRPGELLRLARVHVWDHRSPRPAPPVPEDDVTDTGGHLITGVGSPRPTLPMLRHLFQLFSTRFEGSSIEQEACLFVANWVDADRVCLFESDQAGVAPTLRAWWSDRDLDSSDLHYSQQVVQGVLQTDQAMRWTRSDGIPRCALRGPASGRAPLLR